MHHAHCVVLLQHLSCCPALCCLTPALLPCPAVPLCHALLHLSPQHLPCCPALRCLTPALLLSFALPYCRACHSGLLYLAHALSRHNSCPATLPSSALFCPALLPCPSALLACSALPCSALLCPNCPACPALIHPSHHAVLHRKLSCWPTLHHPALTCCVQHPAALPYCHSLPCPALPYCRALLSSPALMHPSHRTLPPQLPHLALPGTCWYLLFCSALPCIAALPLLSSPALLYCTLLIASLPSLTPVLLPCVA